MNIWTKYDQFQYSICPNYGTIVNHIEGHVNVVRASKSAGAFLVLASFLWFLPFDATLLDLVLHLGKRWGTFWRRGVLVSATSLDLLSHLPIDLMLHHQPVAMSRKPVSKTELVCLSPVLVDKSQHWNMRDGSANMCRRFWTDLARLQTPSWCDWDGHMYHRWRSHFSLDDRLPQAIVSPQIYCKPPSNLLTLISISQFDSSCRIPFSFYWQLTVLQFLTCLIL